MKTNSTFNWFSISLGITVFIYLILRAIYVEPLHDEIATLFHYIDYGKIFGKDIILDANNHLLNSVLSKICYSIFGDHLWAIRLPNVLSFILYFYAIYKLATLLKSSFLKYILILSATCIPYILDYFAYSRGYGLSMAFLVFSIYKVIQLNKNYTTWNMLLFASSSVLAIYSNLNIILVSMIAFLIIGIKLIRDYQLEKSISSLKSYATISVITLLALSYAIIFAYLLKQNGALYYGNLDGLWLTTGATLSKYCLNTDWIGIKYILSVFILGFVCHFIWIWKKDGFESLLENPAAILILLLLGNLVAIELMALILHMNYPEDRVGMHLVILFILITIFILDEYLLLRWISIVLLCFPILTVKGFNLHTSQFTPDDRMNKIDFLRFQKRIKDKSSSLYLMQQLVYAYHVRQNNPTHFVVPRMFHFEEPMEEIVSTKEQTSEKLKKNAYQLLYSNTFTRQQIIQKFPLVKKNLFDYSEQHNINTNQEFYSIFEMDENTLNQFSFKKIQAKISAKLHTPQLARETVVIVVDKQLKDGSNEYNAFNLNWAAGKNKTYEFIRWVDFEPQKTKAIKVYLYNPNQLSYEIKELSINYFQSEMH